MENIILPSKIEYEPDKENKNRGIIVVEPCYPGYGTTLGNALRRVLLSSLPGAAVTAVKIKGVSHEFMGIPHVKEDVIEIILNLKQLRLKVFSDEPVILNLEVNGEKEVKAEDIQSNSNAEIINPDLTIATLTDKKAELNMKIWVSKGRGFVPVEERRGESLDPGVIAVDSIYTPVLKVGFNVDNVRVKERTDYDKLILDIETDGTISPPEALIMAANILIDHFKLLIDEFGRVLETFKAKDKKEEKKPVAAKAKPSKKDKKIIVKKAVKEKTKEEPKKKEIKRKAKK